MPRINSMFFYRENEVFLIGGYNDKEIFNLNKIWSFDLDCLDFENEGDEINGLTWENFDIDCDFGDIKLKDFGFYIFDDFIYVFGGYDFNMEVTNSFFMIDLEEFEFVEVEFSGEEPSKRAYCKIVNLERKLVVFGGINKVFDDERKDFKVDECLKDFTFYDLDNKVWEKPIMGGDYPYFHDSFNVIQCLESNENLENKKEFLFVFGNDLNNYKHYILYNSKKDNWNLKVKEKVFYEEEKQIKSKEEKENILNDYKELNLKIKKINIENSKLEANLKTEIENSENISKETIKYKNSKKDIKTEFNLKIEKTDEKYKSLLTEKKTIDSLLLNLTKLQKLKEKKTSNKKKLVLFLESVIKYEEDFTLALDQVVSKCLQNESIDLVFNNDIRNKVILKKINHKETLKNFRKDYKILCEKEDVVKGSRRTSLNKGRGSKIK